MMIWDAFFEILVAIPRAVIMLCIQVAVPIGVRLYRWRHPEEVW